jgi:hypothetical protein
MYADVILVDLSCCLPKYPAIIYRQVIKLITGLRCLLFGPWCNIWRSAVNHTIIFAIIFSNVFNNASCFLATSLLWNWFRKFVDHKFSTPDMDREKTNFFGPIYQFVLYANCAEARHKSSEKSHIRAVSVKKALREAL